MGKTRKPQAGRRLSALLNDAIDAIDESESDDRTRADVVSAMGSEAGISEDTVNEILSGTIDCPPLSRLRGFARVNGIPSLARQRTAAESDGCEHGEEDSARACRRPEMKKRFQNIQMSAGKAENRLAFRAEHSEEALTIYVHDVIGDSFEGLDSATLVPLIDQNHHRELIFNINTPGGSAFDAISVYAAAVLHGNVRADITGMASSAGTILASSAGKIRIAATGGYWIHRAWTIPMGNAAELQVVVNDLLAIDADVADLLATRSGTSVEEIVEMMVGVDGADGTRFNGKEAVELGFADELIPLKEKPTPENEPEQDIVKRSYIDMVVAHRRRAA